MAGQPNKDLGTAAGVSNPIADMTWAHYTGTLDSVYPDYSAAHGAAKNELAEVALRPEAYWFGGWNPNPKGAALNYIQHVQNGNSNVLVQMSDFSLGPWENKACGSPQTAAKVKSNERWNAQFAAGIGKTRSLVVLEPDLPVVLNGCMTSADRSAVYTEMTYAAKKLNALTYTSVYIDAGSSDWIFSIPSITKMLIKSGIAHARGFALNATHFASTQNELTYGQKIVRALAVRGYKDKHFIIDTAENGHPFTHQAYTKAHFNTKSWASRPACVKGKKVRFCQTFGIPPTWQVGLSQWHLGNDAKIADKLVDGYVWFGRPWMKGQSSPFDPSLTEGMAKSTPFPISNPKYAEPTP
jgi:endoglucanase